MSSVFLSLCLKLNVSEIVLSIFFSNSDVIGVDYLALLAQLKTKNITSSVELNVSAMGKLFHD